MTHIFWECQKIKPILNLVWTMLENEEAKTLEWNCTAFIFNYVHKNPKHIINEIVIAVKQFIYRQRCAGKQITRTAVVKELDNIFFVDLYNAKREGKHKKMFKRYSPILQDNKLQFPPHL